MTASNSLNRTAGLSVQSAPASSMSRTSSLPVHKHSTPPHPTIHEWTEIPDETSTSYTFGPSAPNFGNPPSHTHQMYTPSRIEAEVFEDPSDFVAKISGSYGGPTSYPTPTSPDDTASFQQDANSYSQPSQYGWNPPFSGFATPDTPTSCGLTTASTLTSDLSRQSSIAGSSFAGAFDMLRVQSNFSHFSDCAPIEEVSHSDLSPVKSESSMVGQDGHRTLSFAVGAPSRESFSTSHYPFIPAAGAGHPPKSSQNSPQDMQPSLSAQSDSSISSTSSQHRAQRRRQEQLQGARPIKPKASEGIAAPLVMLREPSDHKMIRIQSEDGSSKDVAAIAKVPYQRPVHPKIKCAYCNEHPEGFRGEHELRRHTERMHSMRRKMWVTVDASADGSFLKSCKQCRAGKKYGAYYNAAAHLRRAHFNPRKRGRKSKGEEKRGGKAGGDQPPMEYLKQHWMKEVEDIMPDPAASADVANEANDDEECTDDIPQVSCISQVQQQAFAAPQPIVTLTPDTIATIDANPPYGLLAPFMQDLSMPGSNHVDYNDPSLFEFEAQHPFNQQQMMNMDAYAPALFDFTSTQPMQA